jgi:hypothetical protein
MLNSVTKIFFPRATICYKVHYFMQDWRFLQQWLWRVLSSGIQRRVVHWKSTDVSEVHITSIFRFDPDDGGDILVDFQQTTQCYVPEDSTPYIIWCLLITFLFMFQTWKIIFEYAVLKTEYAFLLLVNTCTFFLISYRKMLLMFCCGVQF